VKRTEARSPTKVAFEARSPHAFEETVARCRQELGKEGFGVLTEIDVEAKFKEKLGVDTGPYLILGACHPPSAYRALKAVPEVGVLLPCNVTVSVEAGRTVVRAMDPKAVMDLLPHPDLQAVAAEVGAALERVVEAVVGKA
jgi:uncharacterized protein (DUF302 family)